jgi:hypothetical protein
LYRLPYGVWSPLVEEQREEWSGDNEEDKDVCLSTEYGVYLSVCRCRRLRSDSQPLGFWINAYSVLGLGTPYSATG